MRYFLIIAIVLTTTVSSRAQDSLWTAARPDGHAPASVMGDHYHKKGGFMVSYRIMTMTMIHPNVSPQPAASVNTHHHHAHTAHSGNNLHRMQSDMHMVCLMYAPTSYLTLAVMGDIMNYKIHTSENNFDASLSAGDLMVTGLIKIMNRNRQSIHLNTGLYLPTGNISLHDAATTDPYDYLEPDMQPGSGTLDPFTGFTYQGQTSRFSWGMQHLYRIRTGMNAAHYNLGNRYDMNAWGAIRLSEYFSLSTGVGMQWQLSGTGTASVERKYLKPDAGLGANCYIPNGSLQGLRIGAEIRLPWPGKTEAGDHWMATAGIKWPILKKLACH